MTRPVLTAREAYLFCSRSDRGALEHELELRGAEPAALAIVRSMIALYDGDVASAEAILSRAIASAQDDISAGYLIDSLVPLLASRLEYVRAATILERDPPCELRALHASQVAWVAAQSGDRPGSDLAYAAAEELMVDVTEELFRAKIVGRGALAAFYLGKFELAVERALYAAERNVKAESFRLASTNYGLLAAIYREQYGDAEMARYFAVRQTLLATRVNDLSLITHGLSIQIEIASEAGDERLLGAVRRRLLAIPGGTRYRERLSVALGEILPAGWAGDFIACATKATALREGDRTDVERMFCEALLAVAAYARGFRDDAAAWSAAVIKRGADRSSAEMHAFRIARILVGHVEIACGRLHNGRRLLVIDALRNVPEEPLVHLVAARTLDEADAPKWLRGYVRLLQAADACAQRLAPVTLLTRAESELLPIMALGRPVKQVAAELGKRESTVRAQIREIARKLGTHSLMESVAEARRQGLL